MGGIMSINYIEFFYPACHYTNPQCCKHSEVTCMYKITNSIICSNNLHDLHQIKHHPIAFVCQKCPVLMDKRLDFQECFFNRIQIGE